VEFVIVFPVLLLLVLLFIQTTLILTARHVVHYAAFCAARSAIVYIPVEDGEYGDDFVGKAHQAAAIACIPISPKLSTPVEQLLATFPGGDAAYKSLEDMLNKIFSESLKKTLGEPLVYLGKYVNSYNLTSIDIFDFSGNRLPAPDLDPDEDPLPEKLNPDIQVKVTHNYVLRIPIINKIFYYASLPLVVRDENASVLDPYSQHPDLPSYSYKIPISATCTLTVEGGQNKIVESG